MMSDSRDSEVSSRLEIMAAEVGSLRGKVAAVAGRCEQLHDKIGRSTNLLQAQITDNRENLVELVGKGGGNGRMQDLRDDMTELGIAMRAMTVTHEQMNKERVETAKEAAVTSFMTRALWAIGGVLGGAVATYLLIRALGG